MKLYATVISESIDGEPDSNDNTDSTLDIQGVEINLGSEDDLWDLPVASGDTVYVLVQHYSDGDTFSNYEGAEVVDIFANLVDAEIAAEERKPQDRGYFGCHIGFKVLEGVVP